MRLHEADGTPRTLEELIEEFQARWEWTGELAFGTGWGAVDYQRFLNALNVMWEDWRVLRPMIDKAIGYHAPGRPRVEVAP